MYISAILKNALRTELCKSYELWVWLDCREWNSKSNTATLVRGQYCCLTDMYSLNHFVVQTASYLPLHRRGSGSIPGQSIWDLWWGKWHCDRLFFPSVSCCFPFIVVPPITKNLFVYYTCSLTQLYFTQQYSRDTTTCFGPICGPSSGCDLVYYTFSWTQLYFTQQYSRDTTTCFGPICGPSSGCGLVYYTFSWTQLYFTQQYSRDTTTCFGPYVSHLQVVI